MVLKRLRAHRSALGLATSALAGLAVGVLASYLVQLRPPKAPIAVAAVSPTLESVQALVKQASHGNAVAEKLLIGRPQGLTGAVVRANGQPFVAWITPDGKGLLVGALFNDQGDNLTIQAMQANQVVATARSGRATGDKPQPANGAWIDAVEKADGFTEGRQGMLVHAFVDLNCGYCSLLYQQLRPLIDRGQVRVHWIPVAILHESSATLAAEVMQAPTPAARLAEHEAKRNASRGAGGLRGQPPSARTQQILETNGGLLKVVNEGLAATPVMLFRGKNGQVFQHAGLLREASDLLAAGP